MDSSKSTTMSTATRREVLIGDRSHRSCQNAARHSGELKPSNH